MGPPTHANPGRVVWTHAAERKLQQLVDHADGPEKGYVGALAEADGLFAAAFPDSVAVVLDLFVGYRPRTGQYIALVDVRGRDRPGTVVVKVAECDDELREEANAWAACRPAGFTSDAVFMEQERRYHPSDPHRLVGVVYQDARRHIATDRLLSLEDAFLGAVRFATPEPDSLVSDPRDPAARPGAINALFARIRATLHHRAGLAQPAGDPIELNPDGDCRRRFADSLPDWTRGVPRDLRGFVAGTLHRADSDYIDPVEVFQRRMEELCAALIEVHRGPAHGDLHGRNVLVGVTDNRAESPALFDYEHMSRGNLIAWDFAKLETELKIRAYRHVFPFVLTYPGECPPPEYVSAVWNMERELAELPRAATRTAAARSPEQNRLFDLLARYHRLVAQHLGSGRRYTPPCSWETEYKLVSACYGLYTVRWTAEPHERIAALLSSAAAAVSLTRLLNIVL